MKRRYQIDQQRAVQQFRQLAREENPNLQMIFLMAEVVGLLQEGVGHLLREAGLSLMNVSVRLSAESGRLQERQKSLRQSPLSGIHLSVWRSGA